jgi:hypothetical protein
MESICAGRGENTVRSGRRFVVRVYEKDHYGVAAEAIRAAIVAFPIPVGPPARPSGGNGNPNSQNVSRAQPTLHLQTHEPYPAAS